MNGIFGIGIAELFFIAVIALVVLGPERLPATFRELAKYYRMARNLSGDLTSQFSEELKALDDINPQKIIQEVLDDPAMDDLKLDDINPKKISEDLAKDEAKNRKQTTPKKTTPKKTSAKKSETQKAENKSTDSEPQVDSVENRNADDSAEKSEDKVESAVVDDASIIADDDAFTEAVTADNENLPAEIDEQVDTDGADADNAGTDDDVYPDNRIAPDDLTANLEQDAPKQDTIPSKPASLSVNGTHDSVEDRA